MKLLWNKCHLFGKKASDLATILLASWLVNSSSRNTCMLVERSERNGGVMPIADMNPTRSLGFDEVAKVAN